MFETEATLSPTRNSIVMHIGLTQMACLQVSSSDVHRKVPFNHAS